MTRRLAFALLLLAVAACDPIERPLVIGAKDFAEQRIVAEIVAQHLRASGIPAEVDETPRDSLAAIEALWRGDIDLYVEYSGSLLALAGHPPLHGLDASFAEARTLAAEHGLAFGPALGFRDDFVALVRPGSRIEPRSTLADLALRRTLRVGMPADFRARPADGFDALVRRYGWRAEATLVTPSSPAGKDALYAALLAGEIDLAIGFRTDPQIEDFGLRALEDDGGFFPAYAAAPLTRAALLAQRPALAEALETLGDTVTTEAMRTLVAELTELDAEPFAVAARFLQPAGTALPVGVGARPLAVAVGELDARAGQAAEIVLALRRAFPGRRIDLHRAADPLALMLRDEVRYALVSGPAFFTAGDGLRARPRGPADALVPVGFDFLHLLAPAGGPALAWDAGVRLGVGVPDGTTARTANFMAAGLSAHAPTLVTSGDGGAGARLEALRAGRVDGLLVMAELGHPLVQELLAGGLELRPLDLWARRGDRVAFPFLQPVTIPATTYAGQPTPVPTLGSQVVLAAERPDPSAAVGIVGPGSAAIRGTLPIGSRTVARIRDALETEARLDPSLPVALAARGPAPERPEGITQSPAGSLVTILLMLVLGGFLRLYLGPPAPGHGRA